MRKYYQLEMPESVPTNLGGRDETARVLKAKKIFEPMYLIKQVAADPKKLEMSFDCSAFQYQLKRANRPVEDHVFQTIFLNKKDASTWTRDEIKQNKISELCFVDFVCSSLSWSPVTTDLTVLLDPISSRFLNVPHL